ncbi:sensor domain-containing protein [Legionella cherrii]|uniref:Regulatory protein n=1 Tax=Legionella cherrii TaxID=28084 RepID=A0A0W0SCJ0_9GAMM|nr:PAS domain S-box protein [Legionella cherrii]KTC81176.1 regulatory protein (GGDEF, EAL, PAS and PAC domains) [Legionella cherrii]VEB33471.1 putative regulatory protein [Legionella cherrii]
MCAKRNETSEGSLQSAENAPDRVYLQTEQHLRNIIENAPTGIVTMSINGDLLQVNPGYCEITGYFKEELEGMNYRALSLDDDLAVDNYNVQQLIEGKINSYRLEKRYLRKDGKIIWVQVTRSLIRDDSTDNPLYFIAQIEDITLRKEAENTRKNNEAYLRNIVDHAPSGIVTISLDGQLLDINPAFCRITGYDKDELERMNYKKLTYAEDFSIAALKVQELLDGKIDSYQLEKRYVRKDETIIWVLATRSLVRDIDTEDPLYFIVQVVDITERKEAELMLRESEARFRSIMDNAPIGMAIQSLDGQFLQVNRALCEITGYKKEALEQLSLHDIVYPDDLANESNQIQRVIEGKDRYYQIEKRIRKNGTFAWVAITRSILRNTHTGAPLYFIVQVEDINEQILNREKIRYLAYHDILTGLPNRQLLYEELIKTLALAKRHERIFAIMFIDLDKFKNVNDTFGHDVGDNLLKEVTSRLNKSFRASDLLARTGGDEFIVVLTEIKAPQDAAIVADKTLKIIRKPIIICEQSMQIGASIGIVTYPEHGHDITELMKKADSAMYTAKYAGGNQYHFY